MIPSYEEFHGLKTSDDFSINAIRLAKRYFSEKHLPDSAIDLMDRTMALLKIENDLRETGKVETVEVEHLMKVVSQKQAYLWVRYKLRSGIALSMLKIF